MEINERIQTIARLRYPKGANGVNFKAFGESLGSSDTVVKNYITGIRNPTYDFLIKLLDTYPDISAEWLMRGEGDMYKTRNLHRLELEEPKDNFLDLKLPEVEEEDEDSEVLTDMAQLLLQSQQQITMILDKIQNKKYKL